MIALPKETWTIFQIRNWTLSVLGQKSCKRHGSDIVTNRPPSPSPPPPPTFPTLERTYLCRDWIQSYDPSHEQLLRKGQ